MISEIQEGEEWLARLRKELEALTSDLEEYKNVLSQYTIENIEYAIDKTAEAIAMISLDMIFIGEKDEA